MNTIEAYKTTDGQIFEEYTKAIKHQSEIVGELLDSLIPVDESGRMTHVDRHRLLMSMLKSKELRSIVRQLYIATECDEWEECRQYVARNH
jgi:hypothetical protein